MKYTLELIDGEYVNRAAAINALNLYRWHRRGQPVIVIYSDGHDTKKALLAIGVKSSDTSSSTQCGLNCYVIIGDGYNITNNIETIDIDNDTIQYNDNNQISVNTSVLYEAGNGIAFTQSDTNRYVISANIDNDTITFDSFGRLVANTSGGSEYVAGPGIYIDPYTNEISVNVDGDTIIINENGQLVGSGGELMENITWADLKEKRDQSLLVPGKQYRIIDYSCETTQEKTISAHHPFDIIVHADSENQLNENARAIQPLNATKDAVILPFALRNKYIRREEFIYFFHGYYIDDTDVCHTDVYRWRASGDSDVDIVYTSSSMGNVCYENPSLTGKYWKFEGSYSSLDDVPDMDMLRSTYDGNDNPTSLIAYNTNTIQQINGYDFYVFNWSSDTYEEMTNINSSGVITNDYRPDHLVTFPLLMTSDTPSSLDDVWIYEPQTYQMLTSDPQTASSAASMGWINTDYPDLVSLYFIMAIMYAQYTGDLTGIPADILSIWMGNITGWQDFNPRPAAWTYAQPNPFEYTVIHDDGYFTNSKLESWRLKYCIDNDKTRFLWASAEEIDINNKWYTVELSNYVYNEKFTFFDDKNQKTITDGLTLQYHPLSLISIEGQVYMKWKADGGPGYIYIPDSFLYTPLSTFDFTAAGVSIFNPNYTDYIIIMYNGSPMKLSVYLSTNYSNYTQYTLVDKNYSLKWSIETFEYTGTTDPDTGLNIYNNPSLSISMVPYPNGDPAQPGPYNGQWGIALKEYVYGYPNPNKEPIPAGVGNIYLYRESMFFTEEITIPEGKGVVYYMQDEFDNECPYDFKNIQYATYATPREYVYNVRSWYDKKGYTGKFADQYGKDYTYYVESLVTLFPPTIYDHDWYMPVSIGRLTMNNIEIDIPDNKIYIKGRYDFTQDTNLIFGNNVYVIEGTNIYLLTDYINSHYNIMITSYSGSPTWASAESDMEFLTVSESTPVIVDNETYYPLYLSGNVSDPYIYIYNGEICVFDLINGTFSPIMHYWVEDDPKMMLYKDYVYNVNYGSGVKVYVYTFNMDVSSSMIDHSIGYRTISNISVPVCVENKMKGYHSIDQITKLAESSDYSCLILNGNVFLNVDERNILNTSHQVTTQTAVAKLIEYFCAGNLLEANCVGNRFGHRNCVNRLGMNSSNNIFSNYSTYNTLGSETSANNINGSYNSIGSGSSGNEIGGSYNTIGKHSSKNQILKESDLNTIDDACENNSIINGTENILRSYCKDNTIDNSSLNIFEQDCTKNILSSSSKNYFGQSCSGNNLDQSLSNVLEINNSGNVFFNSSNNTLGSGCHNNTFNGKCIGNTLGTECQNNIFRGSCSDNTLGSGCRENIFEQYFTESSIGNYVFHCVFGYNVNILTNPTIDNVSNYAYITNMQVFDGVEYCYVTSSDPSWSGSYELQNCQIMPGTKDYSNVNTFLNIIFPAANVQYTQIAGYDSSNNLIIKNPMD